MASAGEAMAVGVVGTSGVGAPGAAGSGTSVHAAAQRAKADAASTALRVVRSMEVLPAEGWETRRTDAVRQGAPGAPHRSPGDSLREYRIPDARRIGRRRGRGRLPHSVAGGPNFGGDGRRARMPEGARRREA